MEEQQHSTDTAAKSFFSTLPGILTAGAGFITAIGGFIVILNKSGCMTSKTAEQYMASDTAITRNLTQSGTDTSKMPMANSTGNVSYFPEQVKVTLKSLVYKITSATVEVMPSKELILTLKIKCTSDSKYEYHFYSHYLRIKIGEDNYSADPASPSDSYQSIGPYSFKNIEYNFKLPAGTKTFNLIFYDDQDEIGSSLFTIK